MFNLLRRTVKTPGSHVTGQVEELSRSVPKSSTVQNDGRRIQVRVVPEALAFAESGACAAAVAAIRQGWMDSPVQLELPGGKLSIEWAGDGQPVMMTGPAARVYEGQIRL